MVTSWFRWLAIAVVVALVAAACGDDDDGETGAESAAAVATAPDDDIVVEEAEQPPVPAGPELDAEPIGDDMASPGADPGDFVPLPPQPDGVPFPTDSWPEADLAERIGDDGAAAVEVVVADAFDEGTNPYGTIEGVVVIHEGRLVVERYGRGYDGDEPHVSWSLAKSVTHAMLGIATRDGLVNVFSPAPIDEWSAPGDPRAEITSDDLVRMSSGLAWSEVRDDPVLLASAVIGPASDLQAGRELVAEPGTVFNYSTGSTAINGKVLGDAIGTEEAFRAWAGARLFGPLGISSVELVIDGDGYFVAGYGANMTARDFARFGLLYQRNGIWDGQRILPDGWVDYARTPSSTRPDYGAGFWLDGDTFSGAGFRGQRITMVPEQDLVIVVLSNEGRTELVDEFVVDLIAAFS